MTPRRVAVYLGIIAALLALLVGWYAWAFAIERNASLAQFDGERAYADVQTQVAFGPRVVGSAAHARTLDWIKMQLEAAGWRVEIQQTRFMDHPIQNLRAYRTDTAPAYILGAHYDTRMHADRDPDVSKRDLPVPGANDGASGVAVLIELARTLPEDAPPVWLVFFDAEDNGNIPGWDWSLGATAFAQDLKIRPSGVVVLDMVGDEHLSFPMERNSDEALRLSIWETAARLGHADVFVPQVGRAIIDDHVPFLQAGIPAVDIIDIDYTEWHTTSDLPQHVSPESLDVVGQVLWTWLMDRGR